MKKNVRYAVYAIAGVVAFIAVWMFFRPVNNDNRPEGTDWLCTSAACGTHFNLTMKELGEHEKKKWGQLP